MASPAPVRRGLLRRRGRMGISAAGRARLRRFFQRLRLVFKDTWIGHCGWYGGSWVVRLVDHRHTKFDGSLAGKRARVGGPVRRLVDDIVDEDRKGLAAWLHKHVRYAQLEAQRREQPVSLLKRLRRVRTRDYADTRPLIRIVLEDVIFPSLPAKPAALFIYMYVVRLGPLDGRAGLRFCFFHACYQSTVGALQAEAKALSVMPPPAHTREPEVRHAYQAAQNAGPLLRQDHLRSPSGSPGDSPNPVSSAPIPGTLPSRRGGPGSRLSQQPRGTALL